MRVDADAVSYTHLDVYKRQGLLYVTEGTYLEELEEDTIRSEFRSLLTDSIYYKMCIRDSLLDSQVWRFYLCRGCG